MTEVLKILVPAIVSVISMIMIWSVSSRNVDKQIKASKENLDKRLHTDLKKETLNLKWAKYFEIFSAISLKLNEWNEEIDAFSKYDEIFEKAKWFLPQEIRDILHECNEFSLKHASNPLLKKDYNDITKAEQNKIDELLSEQMDLANQLENSFKRYLDNVHN